MNGIPNAGATVMAAKNITVVSRRNSYSGVALPLVWRMTLTARRGAVDPVGSGTG